MNADELETIIHLKKNMLRKPLSQYSEIYIQTYEHLNNICLKYCRHHWVEDEVEPTPDEVIQITYCSICECNAPK